MSAKEIDHRRRWTRWGVLLAVIAMAPGAWAAIAFGPGIDWVSGVTPASHSVEFAASLVLADPSGISESIALTGPGSVANGGAHSLNRPAVATNFSRRKSWPCC